MPKGGGQRGWRSAAVTNVRLRQAPDQGRMPSTCLRTPQMGASEVATRGMRAGQGQTLRDPANKPVRGKRVRRALLLPALGFGPITVSIPARAPPGASDETLLGGSTVGQTSGRKRCYVTRYQNRGEDLRGSSQSLDSICSRRGQTPTTLHGL